MSTTGSVSEIRDGRWSWLDDVCLKEILPEELPAKTKQMLEAKWYSLPFYSSRFSSINSRPVFFQSPATSMMCRAVSYRFCRHQHLP